MPGDVKVSSENYYKCRIIQAKDNFLLLPTKKDQLYYLSNAPVYLPANFARREYRLGCVIRETRINLTQVESF